MQDGIAEDGVKEKEEKPVFMCMATAAGKIACFTKGGIHDIRRLVRLRTDGTTGGESMEGGRFTEKAGSFRGQAHMALSPDGKWVYVTG